FRVVHGCGNGISPSTVTQAARALQRVHEAPQWWLGDWWNAGVKWGEGQAVCETVGLHYGTVRNAGVVAGHIQLSRRRDNLSFRHHAEVCVLDDREVEDRFLLWCEEPLEKTGKARSVRELREAIQDYLDRIGIFIFCV